MDEPGFLDPEFGMVPFVLLGSLIAGCGAMMAWALVLGEPDLAYGVGIFVIWGVFAFMLVLTRDGLTQVRPMFHTLLELGLERARAMETSLSAARRGWQPRLFAAFQYAIFISVMILSSAIVNGIVYGWPWTGVGFWYDILWINLLVIGVVFALLAVWLWPRYRGRMRWIIDEMKLSEDLWTDVVLTPKSHVVLLDLAHLESDRIAELVQLQGERYDLQETRKPADDDPDFLTRLEDSSDHVRPNRGGLLRIDQVRKQYEEEFGPDPEFCFRLLDLEQQGILKLGPVRKKVPGFILTGRGTLFFLQWNPGHGPRSSANEE